MTAVPSRRRAHSRSRLAASRGLAAIAAMLVVAALAGPAAAVAPSPEESPTPSPSAAVDSALGLSLGLYRPAVLEPGERFVATASISNDGLEPVDDVAVELRVTSQPLAGHADIDGWLAGTADLDLRLAASTAPAGGTVPAGDPIGVPIVATPAQLGLPAETAGVYGVEIALVDDGDAVHQQRAVFVWHDAATAAAPMVLVATVAGSDARAGALYDAAIASNAVILADPTALDEGDRTQALALGDTHALPAGHLDVAAIAFADEPGLLDFGLNRTRTTFEQDVPWLAVVPRTDEALVIFARQAGAAGLLLDAASVAEGAPALGEADGMLIISPNGPVSLALGTADPTDPTAPAAVVAHAFVATQVNGGAPIVVSPGARWPVTEGGAPRAVAALLEAPWIAQTTWADATESWPRPPVEVSESAPAEDAIPGGIVIQAVSALDGARLVANTTVDPVGVLGDAEDALLSALSYDGRLDVSARGEAMEAAIDALNDIRNSVYIASDTDVNLLSSSGALPVTVRNELGAEITLQVLVTSGNARLVVRDIPTVVVPANGEAVALVPAHAVASANVDVTIELLDADGRRLGSSAELRLRVRPEWGDVFTWAVAVMFGLLLVAGTVRTIRRGRGETRGERSEEPRGGVTP